MGKTNNFTLLLRSIYQILLFFVSMWLSLILTVTYISIKCSCGNRAIKGQSNKALELVYFVYNFLLNMKIFFLMVSFRYYHGPLDVSWNLFQVLYQWLIMVQISWILRKKIKFGYVIFLYKCQFNYYFLNLQFKFD